MYEFSFEIGDSRQEVVRASTLSPDTEQKILEDPIAAIMEPYRLNYRYKGAVLKLDDLGGHNSEPMFTFSPSRRGGLDSVTIKPHRGFITLSEAMELTERLRKWFVEQGFTDVPCRSKDGPCSAPQILQSKGDPYPLRTLADVESSFTRPGMGVEEVEAFHLGGDGVRASLGIVNVRRMRESAGAKPMVPEPVEERQYVVDLHLSEDGLAKSMGL